MYYDSKNVRYARELRKNMTPWERKLWYLFLRNYSVKFVKSKLTTILQIFTARKRP